MTLSPHRCQSTVGTCRAYKGWYRQQSSTTKGYNQGFQVHQMHQVQHKNNQAIQDRTHAACQSWLKCEAHAFGGQCDIIPPHVSVHIRNLQRVQRLAPTTEHFKQGWQPASHSLLFNAPGASPEEPCYSKQKTSMRDLMFQGKNPESQGNMLSRDNSSQSQLS